MWKNKWQRVFFPFLSPQSLTFHFIQAFYWFSHLDYINLKHNFQYLRCLKVTIFDKSYSPGCQIKLTWAMEREQKNKEAEFDSLVFAKWDKINPSEGEAPALTGKPARVVAGNVTEIQEFCWLASQRSSGLFVVPPTQVFQQTHQVGSISSYELTSGPQRLNGPKILLASQGMLFISLL